MEYIALAIGIFCLAGIIIIRIIKRKRNTADKCCGNCTGCPYSKNCLDKNIK